MTRGVSKIRGDLCGRGIALFQSVGGVMDGSGNLVGGDADGDIRPGMLVKRPMISPGMMSRSQPFQEAKKCFWERNGRGDWIRTSDFLLPKQTRYQTALRPGPEGADTS